jgi:hypothetical protein
VPGTRITDQQVHLYMKIRKNKSQALAAAKAGIGERSARRIERSVTLPSQSPRRYWRSRADPFADVWDSEVVPLLKSAPKLMAITLLRKLQDDHPDRFPDGVLRTLQRHVRQWRAVEGPPKEMFFPQDHSPGQRGLSDFTAMGSLRVTIAGAPFVHILYHFVPPSRAGSMPKSSTAARASRLCPRVCRTRSGRLAVRRANTAATACRPHSRTWPRKRTSPCATRGCSITTA